MKYIVILQQVVGSLDMGYTVTYSWDGQTFNGRQKAIQWGFKLRGSDDFNIGVLEGDRLISYGWMDDDFQMERDQLDEISNHIALPFSTNSCEELKNLHLPCMT